MQVRAWTNLSLVTKPNRSFDEFARARARHDVSKNRIMTQIRQMSGAEAWRIVAGPLNDAPHSHDWPILSVFLAGESIKLSEDGEVTISSPSAVWHPAGAVHANIVGGHGSEQIDILCDPAWLQTNHRASEGPVRAWIGGSVALEARKLAKLWTSPCATDQDLRQGTAQFLSLGFHSTPRSMPSWVPAVLQELRSRPNLRAADLAPVAGVAPQWLAQAFRAAMGEGLSEMSMRIRVEQAAFLLGTSDSPIAEIAVEAGFCDQSHMNRCFRALLGRTPIEVRAERKQLDLAS